MADDLQAKHNEPTCCLHRVLLWQRTNKRAMNAMKKRGRGCGSEDEEEEEEGAAAMRNSSNIFMHFSQTRKIIIKII